MVDVSSHEGLLAFGDFSTWYRVTGDLHSGLTPLVVVHGGPGCSHDYLENLVGLARGGRAIIHYDQVGGGRSTLLPTMGAEFWTVNLFLSELDNLLSGLGVRDGYHLLGQSWGGMLAAEHSVQQPPGLRSLVVSNSPASMALWSSEAKVLRSRMDPAVAEVLDRHESQGSTTDPEYVRATQIYYDEHVCRVVPNPPELVRTNQFMARDSTVYNVMNGPNEFYCVGTLREWTIEDRAHLVAVPTLLLSGRYDEATPRTVQPFYDAIRGARWEIFESSSHMPFIEERDRYLEVVDDFLAEVEGQRPPYAATSPHSDVS
ncbi:MAG: proline iminopeptidase-family hydrolase [Acidimicrobiales bacterium]